ncbi:hypothetical protein Agabi119p4_2223 [Agaricus bisporus var. burnettii]|uniref:BTB domain-containing protein n=1 Tax=Agaricus bisporus var. burnettii TaxID=192524 RepID=A0A8H7F8V3_AGABI|nr:hypothetical protein Agabi119p4_2223 [Agaricus bisporus var. burnettii]
MPPQHPLTIHLRRDTILNVVIIRNFYFSLMTCGACTACLILVRGSKILQKIVAISILEILARWKLLDCSLTFASLMEAVKVQKEHHHSAAEPSRPRGQRCPSVALINWLPIYFLPHLQRTSSTLPATNMPTDLHNDMEYYIEPLIFQVEDTLYRIPREYLSQESTIIRDMLQIPQSMDSDSEGSADSKPIIIQQIKATSFRILLQFLFNLDGPGHLGLSKEDLITLLELCRKWDMQIIRNKVIDQLRPLLEGDPAHKWNLAKEYGINQWMQPSLERLIRRSESLGEWEYLMLDQDTFLAVAAIRETCYSVLMDTVNYSGSAENTNVSHWEVKQGRGAINVDLSSVIFDCPRPAPYVDEDGPDTQSQDCDNIRAGEFYFEPAVFKLGNCLYQVSNQPFTQHSPIFRRRFEKLGFAKYDTENPCVLSSEISSTDFTNLLRFFFPPPQITYERTSEEWASVLRLSSRWEMDAVKKLAVDKLTELGFGTSATKLRLAKDLGVEAWFTEGMRTLITREQPLAASEYQTLDMRHVVQAVDLRERAHARHHRYHGQIVRILPERGELPWTISLSDRLAPLL